MIGISAINAESAVSCVSPGAEIKPFKGEDPGFPPEQIRPREGIFYSKVEPGDTSNPSFDYDPNKCVLCGICLRTCEDVHGVSALHFVGRGYGTKIAFFGDKSK